MTLQAPVADLDTRFSSPDATAALWTDAEQQLQHARIYWLATVHPQGRPHVTPLIGIWLDGSFFFCTGEEERKGRNLASNRQVTITTGCNSLDEGLDIVLEGEAVVVGEDARLHRVAEAYVAKYGEGWRFAVRDGGFFHTPGSPDGTSGWDGDEDAGQKQTARALVFEVTPAKALGFGRGDLFSQTRWRFSSSPEVTGER